MGQKPMPGFFFFITRDSYPGDTADPPTLHPYVYVGNNPVIYVDPSGAIKMCQ
jgi:RHS repeat-associated protein